MNARAKSIYGMFEISHHNHMEDGTLESMLNPEWNKTQ